MGGKKWLFPSHRLFRIVYWLRLNDAANRLNSAHTKQAYLRHSSQMSMADILWAGALRCEAIKHTKLWYISRSKWIKFIALNIEFPVLLFLTLILQISSIIKRQNDIDMRNRPETEVNFAFLWSGKCFASFIRVFYGQRHKTSEISHLDKAIYRQKELIFLAQQHINNGKVMKIARGKLKTAGKSPQKFSFLSRNTAGVIVASFFATLKFIIYYQARSFFHWHNFR